MQEVCFPRHLTFPLSYIPHIAGTMFAKSSMLEFYDMNFYSNTVKASGFLRNIPLCGYLAGATHMLIGRLQERTAELLCSIRVQRGQAARRKQKQPGHGTLLLHLPTARLFPDNLAAQFPSSGRVNPNFVSVKPQVIAFRWV